MGTVPAIYPPYVTAPIIATEVSRRIFDYCPALVHRQRIPIRSFVQHLPWRILAAGNSLRQARTVGRQLSRVGRLVEAHYGRVSPCNLPPTHKNSGHAGDSFLGNAPRSFTRDEASRRSADRRRPELERVDPGREQNRTLRLLSVFWPPVFAGEQDVGPPKG